jgi:hypothetical protein
MGHIDCTTRQRIFLLSPANCGGIRGGQIAAPDAAFPLACRLRSPGGAPLGDVFSFVSGLYFRGKLAYARRFAQPPGAVVAAGGTGVLVITAGAGLVEPDGALSAGAFSRFIETPIDSHNPSFTMPLQRDARALSHLAGAACEVVLLGSIASGKYVETLLPIFGDRLRFPGAFVGRGDMSRGGLLLRAVAAGSELDYVPVAGAVRRGPRPPRLEPAAGPGQRGRGRRGSRA